MRNLNDFSGIVHRIPEFPLTFSLFKHNFEMQKRRPSAYKVRAQSAGEGMMDNEAVLTLEARKKLVRRKSSVSENLYVYEITIPDIEEGFDEIVYYKIVIKAIGNIEWTLFRRYSDFYDVHSDISMELTSVVFESEFPKKDTFSWIGPMRTNAIEKRRVLLQEWLQEFLSITNGSVRPANAKREELTRMQEKLDAFLEVKEKIRCHTIAQAVKIEPAVDETAIAIYGATPKVVVPVVAPSLQSVWNMAYDNDNEGSDNDNDDYNGDGNDSSCRVDDNGCDNYQQDIHDDMDENKHTEEDDGEDEDEDEEAL